jgi:hypothetical protein
MILIFNTIAPPSNLIDNDSHLRLNEFGENNLFEAKVFLKKTLYLESSFQKTKTSKLTDEGKLC